MRRWEPKELQEIRQRIVTTEEFILFPEEANSSRFRFNLDNPSFNELGLILLPVMIEGSSEKKIFDLLLDTGAEISLLSYDIAEIIDVPMVGVRKVNGVGYGGVGVGKVFARRGIVRNIQIGGISLGYTEVILGELPTKFHRYNILGILGAKALQNVCLKIDYPKKVLEISV